MGDASASSTLLEEASTSHVLNEEEEDAGAVDANELQLDAEAQALLAELSSSQAEVCRMIQDQKREAEELGGMRDNLATELQELQQERWKLQMYGELEVLKRQLESLKGLEEDLDASEALLDATEPGASPSRVLAAPSHEGGAAAVPRGLIPEGDEDEDEEDYDPEAIAEMQAKLDQDLAEMFAQLQAVKAEAAAVSAHKAHLEAELQALIDDHEADEQEGEAEALEAGETEGSGQ